MIHSGVQPMGSVEFMVNTFVRQWRLLVETALIVVGVLLAKIIVEYFSLAFFQVTSLFTSIIAGAIFIVSIILSGVLADYKESEKLPSEIAAAIENIYDDGLYMAALKQDFNLSLLRQRLQEVIQALKEDLGSGDSRQAIRAIADLSYSFLEAEKLGIPVNHIVRLKLEQGTIRKCVLRIYHIQSIYFVPSAYILANTIVILTVILLILTKMEPARDAYILVAFISYLFIYLLKLIHTMDTPFRIDGHTMDDVSIFLLREAHERIGAGEG